MGENTSTSACHVADSTADYARRSWTKDNGELTDGV